VIKADEKGIVARREIDGERHAMGVENNHTR
jgi:hypothetical protein